MSGNKVTIEITVKDNQILALRTAANFAEELAELERIHADITQATVRVHTWTGNEPVTR